jgi:hypothetical protein
MRLPRLKLANRKAHPAFRILAALFGTLQLLLGTHFFLSNSANVHGQWPLFVLMGAGFLWAAFTGYWPGDRKRPGT